MNISTTPYFNDAGGHDLAATMSSASSLLDILHSIPNGTVVLPPPGVPLDAYIAETVATMGLGLSRNHWVGSTKMGVCGEEGAVVDNEVRVCGMRNLHVVDAGVVNGVPTANPQGVFVVVAEKAAEVLLSLKGY